METSIFVLLLRLRYIRISFSIHLDAYVASFCNRVIFVKDGMIEVELKKTEGQDEFCDQIMKEQKKILKKP